MKGVGRLHKRFSSYYQGEYRNQDLMLVCNFIISELKVKNPKNGSVSWCMGNFSQVCNFLIQWEGK